jgi:hypothetical protein
MLIWLYFMKSPGLLQIYSVMALLLLISFVSFNQTTWSPFRISTTSRILMWSPYYKIEYLPQDRLIVTNNISHQQMVPVTESGPGYSLSHLLARDSGLQPFEDVLIIGAGSGNDVAAALAHGVKHVDAVEIDPTIYNIGRAEHPNRPYDDPRVTIHIDDGRSFVRKTSKKYDLIVYALVDSLVLHSGYSNLRLESFLFTREAFEDIQAKLKPGGMFAVYNYFRQGWIVGRIAKMASEVYGSAPLVIALPHVDAIHAGDWQGNQITFVLMGGAASPLPAITRRFEQQQSFWIHKVPRLNDTINGFGPRPPQATASPESDWNRFAPTAIDARGVDRLSRDDWPFLYLRDAAVPGVNIRSMLLIAALSLAILYLFAPVRHMRPNWQMFFLGAGFMLLETKGVVHMALLFGATWIVNSVVFFAILVMILASNVFVLVTKPKKLWPYYALLAASLLVNILVPMNTFLSLPGWEKVAVSCAVIFVPVFFAGIIFGTSFRDSKKADLDFGSNIAGAILGGLSEVFSLLVGFNHMLVLALAFYLLSALLRRSSAKFVA